MAKDKTPPGWLKGWKPAAAYAGLTPRGLKRWHYHILKVPFVRLQPHRYGKWAISPMAMDLYVEAVATIKSNVNSHKN